MKLLCVVVTFRKKLHEHESIRKESSCKLDYMSIFKKAICNILNERQNLYVNASYNFVEYQYNRNLIDHVFYIYFPLYFFVLFLLCS